MNRSINSFLCLVALVMFYGLFTSCNKPYDVSISDAHANDVPLNVQLLDHTSQTLTIAWDYIDGATSYVVQLLDSAESNNPIDSYVTHSTDYYIFSSLSSRKAYYARVRANFTNSATSDWVYVTLDGQTAKIIPAYGAVSPDFEIPYFKIIDTSSSTITAAWSFTGFDALDSEMDDAYSIYLYSDANAQNLVISWEDLTGLFAASTSSTPKPMRFTFSGLNPSTTYYLKVVDETSSLESTIKAVHTTAAIAAASTAPAKSGDVVLSEDFSKFIHGGDILFNAAGYTVGTAGRGSYSPASGANPVDADMGQATCTPSTEFNVFDGGSVTTDYTNGVGMEGWGKSGNTSTKPGYIKMGGNKGLASLYTPELSSLSQSASLSISFKVGVYAEYGTPYTGNVLVQAVRGAAFSDKGAVSNASSVEVLASQIVDIDQATQETFKSYSVNFDNIPKDARIVISSDPDDLAANKTRFLLDDIKVTIQ